MYLYPSHAILTNVTVVLSVNERFHEYNHSHNGYSGGGGISGLPYSMSDTNLQWSHFNAGIAELQNCRIMTNGFHNFKDNM